MRRTIVLSVLALLALTGCSTGVRGSASPADVVAPPTGDGTTRGGTTGDDGSGDDATDDGTRTPAPAPRPSATRCEDYDPIQLFLTL